MKGDDSVAIAELFHDSANYPHKCPTPCNKIVCITP